MLRTLILIVTALALAGCMNSPPMEHTSDITPSVVVHEGAVVEGDIHVKSVYERASETGVTLDQVQEFTDSLNPSPTVDLVP